jgi:hypothetical protein
MTAADELTAVDPLAVARNWARRVSAIAEHYARREQAEPGFGRIEAEIHGAGRQQFEAAQMAAYMALVSVAGDARRIADALAPPGPPGPVMPPPPDDRPEDRWRDAREPGPMVVSEDALADARRAREHMARWARGDETHDGEPEPEPE